MRGFKRLMKRNSGNMEHRNPLPDIPYRCEMAGVSQACFRRTGRHQLVSVGLSASQAALINRKVLEGGTATDTDYLYAWHEDGQQNEGLPENAGPSSAECSLCEDRKRFARRRFVINVTLTPSCCDRKCYHESFKSFFFGKPKI
jgi:hypothetical protein